MEENGIEKLHQSNQLCLLENDSQQGRIAHWLLRENIHHSVRIKLIVISWEVHWEGVVWVEFMTLSKLLGLFHSHIKQKISTEGTCTYVYEANVLRVHALWETFKRESKTC